MTFDLLTFLILVAVTILIAGIPFALKVHGRLIKIETILEDMADIKTQVEDHEKRIIVCEQEIHHMKGEQS